MEKIITHVDQVTSEWLTSVLLKSGALTEGQVTMFAVDTGRGNWSTSARLTLSYAPDSRGELPVHLFLKMVEVDLEDETFGDSEVTYYTRDYVNLTGAPLIRCYDALFSQEQNRYFLLLDDVSETHVEACAKNPTLAYGLALADGLAVLHAHWWGEQRLAEAGAPIHDAAHIRRFAAIAEPGLAPVIAEYEAALKPHWPAVLRSLFTHLPEAMINRTRQANGFTLIHGDAGCNNILVPRDGDQPLYLIDRQPFNWSLTTWLGVYDLAYAMVLDWEVETRCELEMSVLRRYHERLLRHGVESYPWEQLYHDYRLCVGMCGYIGVEYCRGESGKLLEHIWMPMLQRALTACDDLHCADLW
jgi:hypothetical protein